MNYPARGSGVSELSPVTTVTPAQAGVQKKPPYLDSRLRGNDKAAASCGERNP